MNIHTTRLSLNNRLLTLPAGPQPKDLDEAKALESQRKLDAQALSDANQMLKHFQTMAGQLARIDNFDYVPTPQRPGMLESWFQPELMQAYTEEVARQQQFDGRDLSSQAGHVLTTASNNTAKRDAEMVFTPGMSYSPAPSPLEEVSRLRVEYSGVAVDSEFHWLRPASLEQWNFCTQTDGKQVYEHRSELVADPSFKAVRTLTLEPETGLTSYTFQSNLRDYSPPLRCYSFS